MSRNDRHITSQATTVETSNNEKNESLCARSGREGWVRFNSRRLRPSKEHHAVDRLSAGTTTLKIILSGTRRGLNDSVCGQIGEINIAGISGCTKLPPADNLTS